MVRWVEVVRSRVWPWSLVGGLALLAGCSPKIGDKCTVSTDCSIQGDRLCDPTQPGGYCTVFNCEPNKCPDEAVCVAFNEPSCSSPALSRRFQRTFCMLVCESNDDCRAGYTCVNTAGDPVRQVVDVNPQSTKVCTVELPQMSTPGADAGDNPSVCQIPDSGPPPEPGPDAPDASEAAPDTAAEPDVAPEAPSTEAAPDSAD
jgi:hypothetical protein